MTRLSSVGLDDPADGRPEDSLLDAIDAMSRPLTLFLDCLESATQAEAACIQRLADELPPRMILVLCSRRASAIDLSHLDAGGHLNCLGPRELRLADEEAVQLFSGLVDAAKLEELTRVLEGWPIAIQLTRRLLERERGQAALAGLLSEGPEGLGSYIDQHVLGHLSSSTLDFLTCATELREDSAALIDAARGGVHERHRVQTEVADLNPLIRFASHGVTSFHVHAAVAARLRRLPLAAETRQQLHIRASEARLASGDAAVALKHLMAAGETRRAVELIDETGLQTLLSDLGPPTLVSLIRLLPAPVLSDLPRARLVWIALLLHEGHRDQALSEFRRARAEAESTCLSEHQRQHFQRDAEELQGYFDVEEGRFPSNAQIEHMQDVVAAPAGWNATRILWRLLRGDFRGARTAVDNVAAIVTRRGYRYDAACIATYRGMAGFARGDLHDAERAYLEAAALDPGARSGLPSVFLDIPRAELLYERDALGAADDLLKRHDSRPRLLEDWFDMYVARHGVAARLLKARGDVDGAVLLLRQEAAAASHRGHQARSLALLGLAAEVLSQSGRSAAALEIAVTFPEDLVAFGDVDTQPWRLQDAVTMARARSALAENDPHRVLHVIHPLMARWDAIGLARGSIRTRILAAAAHLRLGALESARRDLLKAIDVAMATTHLRVLLDERDLLLGLLSWLAQDASRRGSPVSQAEFVRSLMKRIQSEQATAGNGELSPLSPRERDVLVALSQGHTNKMIAAECNLAENTVKHHLRRVYRKLKVRRRLQAVKEARRRSLIP